MSKPIIAELYSDGAGNEYASKAISTEMVFGKDGKSGATCGELLEYMLNPEKDELNPEPYDEGSRDLIESIRNLYERGLTDSNVNWELYAINQKEDTINLALEKNITDYITNDLDSILVDASEVKEGQVMKYKKIDLRVSDHTTGGNIYK